MKDKIVYQSNTRDTYFKRAAERKSKGEGIWVENPIQSSYFFNVKWDYGDSKFDYSKCKPHQFFNHFPDTRELTTKQGLNKNLNSLTEPGVDVAQFYPRCFDLSEPKQLDLFIADFNKTSILNLITKHADYFTELMKVQSKEAQDLLQYYLSAKETTYDKFQRQKQCKLKLKPMRLVLEDSASIGLVNIVMLQHALYYCQNLLINMVGMDLYSNEYHNDDLFKKNCFLPYFSVSSSNQDHMQVYSKVSFPLFIKELQHGVFNKIRRLQGWTTVADSINLPNHRTKMNLYFVYLTL